MRINKEFLRELSQLIDELYDRIPANERHRLIYVIGTKTKEKEFNDSESFVDHGIQKDLNKIRIYMYTRTKEISIWISFSGLATFDIVATNDNIWIHGVKSQINEILQKYETRHDLFHAKWKYSIPIYAGLGYVFTLLSYSVINTLIATTGSPERFSIFHWSVLPWAFSLAVFWGHFLYWLYPKFETEHMLQARLRKWIWIVIGSIALTVVGSYIYEYLLPH